MAMAAIMIFASIEVIQFSVIDLQAGFSGVNEDITFGPDLYTILTVGIVLKFALWKLCAWVSLKSVDASETLDALAEDHLNDVWSNIAAVVTGAIAAQRHVAWYIDPIGGVVISLAIIWRWVGIISEQMGKLISLEAPQEFSTLLDKKLARVLTVKSLIKLQSVRSYFLGSKLVVEVEVMLPGDTTLVESHNVATTLRDVIENMDDVERCYVHCDYEVREEPLGKEERRLSRLQSGGSFHLRQNHAFGGAASASAAQATPVMRTAFSESGAAGVSAGPPARGRNARGSITSVSWSDDHGHHMERLSEMIEEEEEEGDEGAEEEGRKSAAAASSGSRRPTC